MWVKITNKYHEPNPPPPIPRDAKGRQCVPRDLNSLQSKWQRIKPMITSYMKYEMLALANPASGESMSQTEQKALKAYRTAKSKDFPFLTTYRILKNQPKWKLDVEQHRALAAQRNGTAQQTPLATRLARQQESAPTVASTDKPQGVKRARRTMVEFAAKEKEEAKNENMLTAYLEAFQKRAAIGYSVMGEGGKRTAAIQYNVVVQQEINDDALIGKDTSNMGEDEKTYFQIRKQHVIARLLAKDHQILKERAAAALAIATLAQVAASRVEVLVQSDEEDYVSDSDGNGYAHEDEDRDGTEGTEGEVEGDGAGDLTETRMGYNGDDEVYEAIMGES